MNARVRIERSEQHFSRRSCDARASSAQIVGQGLGVISVLTGAD